MFRWLIYLNEVYTERTLPCIPNRTAIIECMFFILGWVGSAGVMTAAYKSTHCWLSNAIITFYGLTSSYFIYLVWIVIVLFFCRLKSPRWRSRGLLFCGPRAFHSMWFNNSPTWVLRCVLFKISFSIIILMCFYT